MNPRAGQQDDPFASFEAESAQLGLIPDVHKEEASSLKRREEAWKSPPEGEATIPSQQANDSDPFASFETESARLGLTPDPLMGLRHWVSDVFKAFVKEPAEGVASNLDDVKNAALFMIDALGQPNIGTDDLGMPRYSSLRPLDRNAPELPSVEKAAGKVVESLTDAEYHDETYKAIGGGMRMLSKIAGFGGASKLAARYGWEGVSAVAEFLGSTNPKNLAGAFGFGVTDKVLEDDPSVLHRLGMSTGAALGTEAALSAVMNPRQALQKVANVPYRMAKVMLGINKENFKQDIAKAFVEAGMDAPVSAVTDSKTVAHVNKIIETTPFFAGYVKKRHKGVEEQFTHKIKSSSEKIGERDSGAGEVQQAIEDAFAKMDALAGEGNIMDVSHSLRVAEKAVHQLKKAGGHDDSSKNALSFLEDVLHHYKGGDASSEKMLQEMLSSSSYTSLTQQQKQNFLKALQVAESEQVTTVDAMIEQYKQLNGKMSDKNLFVGDNGKRSLNLLHQFRKALNEDFATYGAQHPAFHEARNEANALFSRVKKRQEWDAFWEKYTNATRDTYGYGSLHKALSTPAVARKLSTLLGDNAVENIRILEKVSKGMIQSKLNDPNPSNSGYVVALSKYLVSLSQAFAKGQFSPALTATVGMGITTWALQSKHFVKKLVEFSERPTQTGAERLERMIKKHTGLGIAALTQEADTLDRGVLQPSSDEPF
jgi:hypothetical protein